MTPRSVTADQVRDAIARLPGDRTRWVGVDGFGGAGKSTFAAALAAQLPDVVVVRTDDFASPSVPEWDWARLQRQVVDPLLAGRPARYQRWEWSTDSGAEWQDVAVGGVVLIEGVSATRAEIAVPWDLTVWVDAPADVRLRRALDRDGPALAATWRDRWIPEELAWAERDHAFERADVVVGGYGVDLGESAGS